jgi:hypothetical protein
MCGAAMVLYQPCTAGNPAAGQDRGLVHPVAARLHDVRHDLVTLLDQLDPGQSAGAAIDRLRIEAVDLGQHRPVVALQRIDAVAAQHGDASLGGLRLERVGEAHAIGAGVVQHEDRFHLELSAMKLAMLGP